MSKFLKALEQAKRDQALRNEVPPGPAHVPEAPPVSSTRGKVGAAKEVPPSPAPVLEAPPVPSTRSKVGAAPSRAAEQLDELDELLVSLVAPAAFEAEQYRALRHTIEQLHNETSLQIVGVSSPATGDGKTITAINLAGALAQAPEARVLLVDADLRRPSIGRLLNLRHANGFDLVAAITDPRLTLDRIAQPRPPFNLSVIGTKQALTNPHEVLKSSRLDELMEEARRRYDYIVVDTPPLVPIQDCRVIGRWVDGFLVVVAAHRTPRRLVEEAVTTLGRAKILGFVFNEDDRASASYYASYSADEPSSSGPPRGTWGGAVRKLGDSLRRLREPSSVGNGRSPRGRR